MINGASGQPLRSSFFSDGLVLWHLMRGRRGVAGPEGRRQQDLGSSHREPIRGHCGTWPFLELRS